MDVYNIRSYGNPENGNGPLEKNKLRPVFNVSSNEGVYEMMRGPSKVCPSSSALEESFILFMAWVVSLEARLGSWRKC